MKSVLLAVSLATASSGCSFLVRPKESRAAPVLDAMFATAAGGLCIAGVITDAVHPPRTIPGSVLCIPFAPLAIVYGLSSWYGFSRTSQPAPTAAVPRDLD